MKIQLPHWKSLSSEMALVYASLSISLVILVTFIGYKLHARVLEERIRQDLLLTVDQTVRGINTEIEERAREVLTFTLVPSLRQAAAHGSRRTERLGLAEATEEEVVTRLASLATDEASSEASAFLSELKEGHPYIAEAFVTDRYGINVAASNPTTDLRQDDEVWWREAIAQKFYLSNLEFDRSAGSYAYSIAIPIADEPRSPIGVIKAVYNLKAIQQLVNSARVGDDGYLVVVASDGTVLSHRDPRCLFRRLGDLPDLAPVAGLISSTLRGVSDFEPGDSSMSGGTWMVGHSRLMRPASLGPLNWTVAALVSRAEVVEPITSVRNSAILAGLVFVLAAIPIVYAVSKRLSQPLVDLAHRADRISEGELDVSLEVPSSNEIGQLARALASMVENLKASHRRTLDINAGLERTVRERTEELQRKNRQIEAQNKKVMDASRLKSQFLANMSHELRTPLNAVLALSEILGHEMSGPLNEEQSKQVTIINRSGKALLRLINDVLDLSKIEAGRMTVEKTSMSLKSLTTLIIDTLRPLAEDKNISLQSSLGPDVPEFMTSDEHKLRQILINLVGNGIKFTEHGSVRMDVTFTPKPPTISFAIADTGIGIPAEATDRIFEEFRQGDGSTTRKYGGTGLGLTISKKMAELMGGTLVVASEVGKGSTFTLSVPYEPSQPVPATAAETLRRVRLQVPEPSLMCASDDSATAQNDSRPLVLVAEDELDNLYIMKKYLNRCGCQVVFARDGNEVLQKARRYKPIAITLDLVLPKKNGWDVLAELKTDPETRHIPVIIASVLDNQERGFCLGAYRYLVKPIDEIDLSDTIHQIQWAERKNVKRVLIIDDNVVDSDLLARLLSESKYLVLQASRGEEGIATAGREMPDLIMLDLTMPDMDGFAVMERLKRDEATRGIPVVIYTAKDLTQSEAARLKRDAQMIFLKSPLEPARMLAEIGNLLKSLAGADPQGDGSSEETSSLGSATYGPGCFESRPQATAPAVGGDEFIGRTIASLPAGGLAVTSQPMVRKTEAPVTAAHDPVGDTPMEPSAIRGLPRDDLWNRTAEAVREMAAAVAASSSGRLASGKTILLVEDDPANQYTIEFMLRVEGYDVAIAENGREGIEKARSMRPDIVLMDLMMPVMGGHEATKLLKDTPGVMEIPVIALTAAAMTGDREKAIASGCDDYVSKPVNREHLLERVAHWVARSREARQQRLERDPASRPPGDPASSG